MPTIKLRIGASLDSSLSAVVFQPLVAAARAARAQVKRELDGIDQEMARIGRRLGAGGGAGAGLGGGRGAGLGRGPAMQGPVQQQQKTFAQLEKEEEKHYARLERIAERHRRREEQARNRENAAIVAQARRDEQAAERNAARLERAAGRANARDRQRAEAATESMRERVSSGAVRNFGGLARRVAGAAGDIASGAGVQFGLGDAARSRFDLEKRATDLSNAGFMAGQGGAAGQRQDPRKLMAEVQAAADAAALDTAQAMEGLQAFVGKTGDLETGRAILGDMARLSRATGAELSDVVSAAGDVSANIGEVGKQFKTAEDKANAVRAVMAAIAGQGKVGAVEMKDLASQMAKLASSAPQFAGPVEGSMAAMGALAQMARAGGGAASATQAATSVQGFVNTFGKKARRDAFKAAGVKIEDAQGMLLDPEEIIVNALKATKGQKGAMNKLFMDASAQRTVRGFQNIYNTTSGSVADKEAAVRAKFGSLRAASMGGGEIGDSFAASMKTGQAQAQLLQNQVQRQLGDAIERVAPRMLELVPTIGKAVEAFAGLVEYIAKNPLKAAFVGFGASVLKSMGEEMLRASTARMFGGGVPGVGGAGGAGGGFMGGLAGGGAVTTAMNTVGAAFAISAAAVTIATVGMMAIDHVAQQDTKRQNAAYEDEAAGTNAATRLRRANEAVEASKRNNGFVTPEVEAERIAAQAEADKVEAALAARAKGGEGAKAESKTERAINDNKALVNSVLQAIGFDARMGDGKTFGDRQKDAISAQKLDSINAVLGDIRGVFAGTLRVTVDNLPGDGAPVIGGAGRTGPGG